MTDWKKLTQWAIAKIEKEYKEDIALLIGVKGHSVDGDGHGECFDYFIPRTERGLEMAQTFMIGGVGCDLYPRSWERTEKTANLDEMALCLAGAEILYAGSEAEAERFRGLQEKLQENLKNTGFMYQKALEQLGEAMDVYRTLLFEERPARARMAAGYIQMYLTKAVAYLNGTFAESGIFSERQMQGCTPQNRMYRCEDIQELPEGFLENGKKLLKTGEIEELQKLTRELIQAVREFMKERRPEKKERTEDERIDGEQPDYQMLAGWYQELSLHWKRIRYFCENNMPEEAFVDGCNLQGELDIVAGEFGFAKLELMDAFDPERLELFRERSDRLEQEIRQIIVSHGAKIREYGSLEDFWNEISERL